MDNPNQNPNVILNTNASQSPNAIEFCSLNDKRLVEIEELIKAKMGIVSQSGIYEYLRNNYNNKAFDDLTVKKSNLVTLFGKLKESTHQGIDFPILYSADKNDKTVVIVALDPLRSVPESDISIAAPFALHRFEFRNKKQKAVFDLIKKLVEVGYNVYVTDIYKLYMKNGNENYKFQDAEAEIFHEMLQEELEIMKPDLIITFGKVSRIALDKINLPINRCSFIHPSGRASQYWKALDYFSDKKCSAENKFIYIHEKIKSALANRTIK